MIENETEEEAERRIKNARDGKMIYARACAKKTVGKGVTAEKRKQVLRAALLGHLPAQVLYV